MSDPNTPPPYQDPNQPNQPNPPLDAAQQAFQNAPPTGHVAVGQGKLAPSEEQTMGLLAHLLGAVFSFLGPLIIWLIKKDESPFINDQGKEALNFQITVFGGYVVAGILSLVLATLAGPLGCIGNLLTLALWVTATIFAIKGGMLAQKGGVYRYPFSLRLIK